MIENNEIIKQINSSIKERMGSIMYGTFFIAWIGWNWKIIYVTFFIDQTLLLQNKGIFKFEYIESLYNGPISIIFHLLIMPALSTYMIIYWISKLDLICARKHYENKTDKEIEKIKQERRLLQKQKEILVEKRTVVRQSKKVRDEMPKEELWKNELAELKNNDYFRRAMDYLKDALYKYRGKLTEYDNFNTKIFEIPHEYIAYLDVNKLINFTDGDRSKVELTEKGKFMLAELIKRRKNSYI